MPFEPTDQINTNADIRIFLEGLLMLVPAPDATSKSCNVYVVNHSSSHDLFVEVSVDQTQPTFPFLRLGNTILRSGLQISTKTPAGISKYQPKPGDPTQPGVFPFKDALDFEELHPGVQLEPSGAHPGVIEIKDGVLYTATERDEAARFERLNTPCLDRVPLGLIIGVNIGLNGKKLILDWVQDSLELPRDEDKTEQGFPKYIVWISNSRSLPTPVGESDFEHLYECLNVADQDRFKLVFKNCDDLPTSTDTTPRVPCIPGVSGG